MPWKLDDVTTLLMAVLILLLGAAINRRVGVLARCNIPEPVTGGIVFVALASLFVFASGRSIVLDPSARVPLLLAFFSTVGLDSDWALLRRSGPRLLLFLSLNFTVYLLKLSRQVSNNLKPSLAVKKPLLLEINPLLLS